MWKLQEIWLFGDILGSLESSTQPLCFQVTSFTHLYNRGLVDGNEKIPQMLLIFYIHSFKQYVFFFFCFLLYRFDLCVLITWNMSLLFLEDWYHRWILLVKQWHTWGISTTSESENQFFQLLVVASTLFVRLLLYIWQTILLLL